MAFKIEQPFEIAYYWLLLFVDIYDLWPGVHDGS